MNNTKWYETEQDNDIVVSTRIRLARNIAAYPYEYKINEEQTDSLFRDVRSALEKANFGNNPIRFTAGKNIDDIGAIAMLERNLISPKLANKLNNAAVMISEDESISIMLNEEDHIRIQVLQPGLKLEQAYEIANQIDDVLDESIDFAFDETFGYLTTCPTNLGTGLRASAMLHLCALESAGLIPKLIQNISKLGITVRGTHGEGSKARGSMYQISNQITLGISEKTAIQNLESIINQIINQEMEMRKKLVQNIRFEDSIYRAYGILKYAKTLTSAEMHEFISLVKVGVSLKMINDIDIGKLTKLEIEASPANLTKISGNNDEKERDIERANMTRRIVDN